jgi:GR25 family glycosyltransferase involved in LPS biosynthesis
MNNNKKINFYVICLEKKKKERCKKTLNCLENNNYFNVEIFKAITPDDYNHNSKNINLIVKNNIQNKNRIHINLLGSKGEIGCALSHISLWRECIRKNEPIIIAEDDLIIDRESLGKIYKFIKEKVPNDTDILLIRPFPFPFIKKKKIGDSLYKVNKFCGFQLYYITPKCAIKLLKNVFPLFYQIDLYVSSCIQSLNLNCYYTNISPMKYHKFILDNFNSQLSHNILEMDNIRSQIIIFVLVIIITILLILFFINRSKF